MLKYLNPETYSSNLIIQFTNHLFPVLAYVHNFRLTNVYLHTELLTCYIQPIYPFLQVVDVIHQQNQIVGKS